MLAALFWALVEGARLFALDRFIYRPALFFSAVFVMYALPSLAAGLAAGMLCWLARGPLERLGKGEALAAVPAILLPGMLLGWGGLLALAYTNFNLLTARALAPSSLLVDAVILGIAGALFAGSTALLLKRGAFERPGPRAWARRLGWAAMGLLLVSVVVVRTADRPAVAIDAARPAAGRNPDHRPNVLLISLDTLRSDHLGAYGYPRETSPFIDRLAREGALFRNSRSQASWTRPSAVSLVTSLYPSTHGVISRYDAIPEDVTTVFEYLKAAGYTTAVFSANPNVSRASGFDQGVDAFYESLALRLPRSTVLYKSVNRVYHPASQLLLRAIAYPTSDMLDERVSRDLWVVRRFQEWVGGLEAQPFMAYVHLLGVHAPYLAPPPYGRAFATTGLSPDSVSPPEESGNMMEDGKPLPESIRAQMIDRYDGLVRFSDAQVRTLVEAVRRRGMLDDTLVIVTADHGEGFYRHHIWSHGGSLYRAQVRIPLVLWAGRELRKRNARIPRGVEPVPVSTIDVMPTVLSIAGIRCDRCDGRSLIELVLRDDRHRATYIETRYPENFRAGGSAPPLMAVDMTAILAGRRKLIHAKVLGESREKWELYDLAADPLERTNLLSGKPDETMPLYRLMKARHEAAVAKRGASAKVDLLKHRRLEEELKALGYAR